MILEGPDLELMKLWSMVSVLSDELSQTRNLAVQLYTQANDAKNQAIHSQTGFVLRRFNLDKPKEVYESELEKMNASMTAENQALLQDNKQLGVLIKEYEQTLETLMSAFRTKARDVQGHELSLVREYEEKLLEREEEAATQDLVTSTAVSQSLARLSRSLRLCLRSAGGEDRGSEPCTPGETDAEWAMSREIELARLEKENEALRRMLGMPAPPTADESDSQASSFAPRGMFGNGGRVPGAGYGKRIRPGI